MFCASPGRRAWNAIANTMSNASIAAASGVSQGVTAGAAPTDDVPLAREIVERGAKREPRDAEIGAQLSLGRDRLPDLELLDEIEYEIPRLALLRHGRPIVENIVSWSIP